jgi:hypothetical protein
VEHYFNKEFKDSILASKVGYTGGAKSQPGYREVRLLPLSLLTHFCSCTVSLRTTPWRRTTGQAHTHTCKPLAVDVWKP